MKKIKINIRPVAAGPARAATSASVDELQKAVGGIDLNAATLPVSENLFVDFPSNRGGELSFNDIIHLPMICQTKGRSKSAMREAITSGSQTLRLKVETRT